MTMTLSRFFSSCNTLPGSIQKHTSKNGFLSDYKNVFGSQQAKNASNVLSGISHVYC